MHNDVVEDLNNVDVPWYINTIIENGTKDKNNWENIAFAI